MSSREAANTGTQATIYQTKDEHANHYNTDAIDRDQTTIYRTKDEHANHYNTDAIDRDQTHDLPH